MNLRLYALFAFILIGFTQLTGQTVIPIKDTDLVGGATYNWTKNNIYELDGLVYLEAGGTLNIEAGTVIKAKGFPTTGDNTSALIITRDAQIFAEGTATQPIIFTSEIDDTNDPNDMDPTLDKGLWGGLIVLGNATIARPGCEDGIEGIDASEDRAKFGGAGECGMHDEESSGILRYVSIRHGGNALTEGNEINGLTLGGVGAGTTIEYIEVIANFDDGIEWFGGTVNVKYATVAFCGDDGFDYDFGWRGNGQFWFYLADDEGSVGRGGEHDGASPDLQEPFSMPTIYNATYVGSGTGAAGLQGDGNDYALNCRDRAGGHYFNSIFTDFTGKALAIEDLDADDMDTYANFLNGDLSFTNNIWFGFGESSVLTDLIDGADAVAVAAQLVADANVLVSPGLAGISRDPNGGLDPRPNAASNALGTGLPNTEGLFFSTVSYVGAFSNQNNWLKGWTALDEYGYLGDLVAPESADCDNPIVIQDGDLLGGQTYTWTADNCYLLDGLVYLEEGGQLYIEAGTVI
ncbi:MAG: T9SS C-terminal target domain-containing protein, partial [Lewinella sp.]|nr:T9SS C-terminal target domain-containing protein [Lewinella sp.]